VARAVELTANFARRRRRVAREHSGQSAPSGGVELLGLAPIW
jgi:hypothetical protein